MRFLLKFIATSCLLFITVCAVSYFTDNSRYGNWTIEKKSAADTSMQWIPFLWTSDSLGNRYFERTGMNIPAKIAGLPYDLNFQFDLGDIHTEIYENTLNSLYALNPGSERKVRKLKSFLQFWNHNKSYRNITIEAGGYLFKSANCRVNPGYGNEVSKDSISMKRPVHLGSIGIDLFKDKVLVIDYPEQRFAILDTIPAGYNINMVPVKLTNTGMLLLPMKLGGRTFDCLFDNGSSIFQLIGSSTRISDYSKEKDNDSLPVSSWGVIHNMTGRRIPGALEIGGQKFYDTEIYADHRKEVQEKKSTDIPYLVTGNALFWNRTIIIDFRNKRFGVK